MSNLKDFVIKNGVLIEYLGNDKDVVIPEGVTEIDDYVFRDNDTIESITLPEGFEYMENDPFFNMTSLKKVKFPKSMQYIEFSIFQYSNVKIIETASIEHITTDEYNFFCDGGTFYTGKYIIKTMGDTGPQFFAYTSRADNTDSFVDFVYGDKWEQYDSELIYNGPKYKYDDKQRIAAAVSRLLNPVELSEKNKKLYVEFLHKNIKKIDGMNEYLEWDEFEDKAKEIILTLAGEQNEKVDSDAEAGTSLIEDKILSEVKGVCQTDKDAMKKLKDFYGIDKNGVPELKYNDGSTVSIPVRALLLTVHEKMTKTDQRNNEVVIDYKKACLKKDAKNIIAQLDETSFKNFLKQITKMYLGTKGRTKKMHLLYPVCRYSDDSLMKELVEIERNMRETGSKSSSPYIVTFREAVLYSNTKEAVLVAQHYRDLKKYAEVRNTTTDDIKKKYLSK